MIRYIREIEDELDEHLVCNGWTMVGLHLWRHEKFGSTNFTKESAVETDTSDFHVIVMEHTKMLAFINNMVSYAFKAKNTASTCKLSARKLLTGMDYI